MNSLPSNFLHDPEEKILGVLGQGYLSSYIAEGSFQKSAMVLTDRRLYGTGKLYQRVAGRNISVKGKQVVSVKDITGTTFLEVNQWQLGLVGGILAIVGLILFLMMGVYAAVIFIIGIIFLAVYLLAKQRYFFVEYAGGAMGTSCRWHSPTEIEAFQREISRLKDKK